MKAETTMPLSGAKTPNGNEWQNGKTPMEQAFVHAATELAACSSVDRACLLQRAIDAVKSGELTFGGGDITKERWRELLTIVL